MSSAASCSRGMASSPAMWSSRAAMVSEPTRLKSNRWQRDWMVAGTFCTSVVARMKMTCSGGSSMIFSRAFTAPGESMWHSSMM